MKTVQLSMLSRLEQLESQQQFIQHPWFQTHSPFNHPMPLLTQITSPWPAIPQPAIPQVTPSQQPHITSPLTANQRPAIPRVTSSQPVTFPHQANPQPAIAQVTSSQPPQITSPQQTIPQVAISQVTSSWPSQLSRPDIVIRKYPKLRGETKASCLAVKLAKEAFFGDEIMARSTVKGHRDHPALPQQGLADLKQVLLGQFPQYWANPAEFEPIWATCEESIGQACKHIRKKLHMFVTQ